MVGWLGLLVAGAGWVMMFTFVGLDVPSFRAAEEVVNVHKLGISLGVIVSGFGLAILGGVMMIFERVTEGPLSRKAMGDHLVPSRPKLGIGFDATANGAVVVSILRGSPAETADLRPRDVIVAINGRSIAGMSETEILSLLTVDAPILDLHVTRRDHEVHVAVYR